MYRDEIIAEVWRLRDAYIEKHGHDLAKMVADLKVRQKNPHNRIVDRRHMVKRPFRPAGGGG